MTLVVDAVARGVAPLNAATALVAVAPGALVCAGDGGRVVALVRRAAASDRPRTALEDALDDDARVDGWRASHVAFFGSSPVAALAATRDGAIAATRDGAIAAWRRDARGDAVGTTRDARAGAPPIVASAPEARARAERAIGGSAGGLRGGVRVRGERWG